MIFIELIILTTKCKICAKALPTFRKSHAKRGGSENYNYHARNILNFCKG